MNNIVVQVNNDKYLVRYQILKSVVSRKHTTKKGKVITRNELHPNSVVVYLYQVTSNNEIYIGNLSVISLSRKDIKCDVIDGYLTYLGRGLSKCSDKDKFDKNIGVRTAIYNIENLDSLLAHDINYKILNTEL